MASQSKFTPYPRCHRCQLSTVCLVRFHGRVPRPSVLRKPSIDTSRFARIQRDCIHNCQLFNEATSLVLSLDYD